MFNRVKKLLLKPRLRQVRTPEVFDWTYDEIVGWLVDNRDRGLVMKMSPEDLLKIINEAYDTGRETTLRAAARVYSRGSGAGEHVRDPWY